MILAKKMYFKSYDIGVYFLLIKGEKLWQQLNRVWMSFWY